MITLNDTTARSEPLGAQCDKEAQSCFWFYTTNTGLPQADRQRLSLPVRITRYFSSFKGS